MLHAWIDPAACAGMSVPEAVAAALADGADAVVLRVRALDPDGQLRCAEELDACGLPPRSALWAGDPELLRDIPVWCAGVHLRSALIERIDAMSARGYEQVGCSVHNADELRRARGAHFVTLSPVFAPRSKPPGVTTLGLGGLADIVRYAPMPVIALGGITPALVAQVAATGVAGVAALSPFARSDRSEARALVREVAAARWARSAR